MKIGGGGLGGSNEIWIMESFDANRFIRGEYIDVAEDETRRLNAISTSSGSCSECGGKSRDDFLIENSEAFENVFLLVSDADSEGKTFASLIPFQQWVTV